MKKYQDMLKYVLANGVQKGDRTGTGTVSVFGYQERFDLSHGEFPLLTTKKLHWKSIAIELLWLISGSTNIKFMKDNGVTIWDEWADENGELGPVYGKQWRRWGTDLPPDYDGDFHYEPIDQLHDVIERIKTKPDCRRLIVTAWNPADVPKQKLPPCHAFYQFYVANGRLSCSMYQRSADAFLGVPYNIASYALLTHMVAALTSLKPGELVHSFGDLHIYSNHMDQVREQLSREPRELPTLNLTWPLNKKPATIDDFVFENLNIIGYDPHPAIKAPVAV